MFLSSMILLYFLMSIGIGFYARSRVKNSIDFVVAGRSLPVYMVTASVFATWFGAESVLGIPAEFSKGGLSALIEDPFGSSLCLILVGLFFAVPLYKSKILTIGDFFKNRYGRVVEVLCSIAIMISYLGWVSAQITALGLVCHLVSGAYISQAFGMILATIVVIIYTIWGGMWSVALTDFVQMIVIVFGLVCISIAFSEKAGGFIMLVHDAKQQGLLNLMPKMNHHELLFFISSLLIMMFGSIPQQDVFQRIASARTAKAAAIGAVLGGILYFVITFFPIFMVFSASHLSPAVFQHYLKTDSQMILPMVVLEHASRFFQVIFFGALLSAIMSTASATLLAPSVMFTENILKVYIKDMSDQRFVQISRIVIFCFGALILFLGVISKQSIYTMVANCYQITLVTCFVPLVSGIYWSKATSWGGLLAFFFGLCTWLLALALGEAQVPAPLAGFLASVVGMVVGSLSQRYWHASSDHARPMVSSS